MSSPDTTGAAGNGDSSDTDETLCLVAHIPPQFGVADLRHFFDEFVQAGRFFVFHYVGRREVVVADGSDRGAAGGAYADRSHAATCCCVVRLRSVADAADFVRRYHGRQWFNQDDRYADQYCSVKRLSAPHVDADIQEEQTDRSVTPRGQHQQQQQQHDQQHKQELSQSQQASSLHAEATSMSASAAGAAAAVAKRLPQQRTPSPPPSAVLDALLAGRPQLPASFVSSAVETSDTAAAAGGAARAARRGLRSARDSLPARPESAPRRPSLGTDGDPLAWLGELHAPPYLPAGNVGTPDTVVRALLAQCRIPTGVVRQLGLRTRPPRPYAQVPPPPATQAARVVAGSEQADEQRPVALRWAPGHAGALLAAHDAEFAAPPRSPERPPAAPCLPAAVRRASAAVDAAAVPFGEFEAHGTGLGGRILRQLGWQQGQPLGLPSRRGLVEPLTVHRHRARRGVGFGARPARTADAADEIDPLLQVLRGDSDGSIGSADSSDSDNESEPGRDRVDHEPSSGLDGRKRRYRAFVAGEVLNA